MDIVVTVELFRDGPYYVAHALELDVSSAGETPERAQAMLREAIEAVIEDLREHGHLHEVLAECGYTVEEGGRVTRAPQRYVTQMKVAVPA